MESLEPGDVILGQHGHVVIEHFGPGASASCVFPQEVFRKVLEGEVTLEDYAQSARNHIEIQLAYQRGEDLPEGATTVHQSLNG